MDFQKILANKPLLYGIIGGLVVVLALFLTVGIVVSSNNSGGPKAVKEKVIDQPLDLLTTDNLGKAIEIQALLAREGITADRRMDSQKSVLYLKKYTMTQRDRALLAIVKSGLVDQNIGLEIFDKGDFTSTKEDKRIRLTRAINGELSRLIRKIPPIENASVFVSIPEQVMFEQDPKPITATVQIVMPSGDKLDNMKVKAIRNLLLGSVNGLEAENISIGGTTEPERIPESGKLNVTFSFAPIPRGVHEVDFVEEETGWTIYGVQLSRQEPYVYVPNFLKSQPENTIVEASIAPQRVVATIFPVVFFIFYSPIFFSFFPFLSRRTL